MSISSLSVRRVSRPVDRQPFSSKEIKVRKIVAGLFMSLDGVVEAPEKWTGPYFNEEIGQVIGAQMASSDTLLLGRVTYQTFAEAFAGDTSGDPVPAQMNNTSKVVVSTTLAGARWQNSTLITGDVADQIKELKDKPGKNINISGSATLVRWLLRGDLLDELDLLVFPVVLGGGQRLFADDGDQAALKLGVFQAFGNGVLHLTYQPA
jgi:dihydrofolate reductase